MTEQEIRASLGIPTQAQRVLIFSQSSHLDWDWLENFTTLCSDANAPYFHDPGVTAPAFDIFDSATSLVLQYSSGTPPYYYYSLAEVAFLQAYVESSGSPGRLQSLQQCGSFWHFCGGGMTSPDNLLPHGETFIRNSLVAKNWIDANLPGLPVQNLWLPDDFGHDSQLPVAAAAMDYIGAGFSRCPGSWAQNQSPLDGSPSVAGQLLQNGADFVWAAHDGSTILGHFMQDSYGQGDSIDQYGTGAVQTNAQIATYLATNGPSSNTPYIFVPIGSDFHLPKELLLTYMGNWNNGTGPNSYQNTGVYAVAATFDHYIQLISFHMDKVQPAMAFDAVPYWLGFYASRPANKIVHYGATRALLAAEVLSVAAGISSDAAAALQKAWNVLVPSTHHDYITGTSGTRYMDVNAYEQLPRLRLAAQLAGDACGGALQHLAQNITPNPPDTFSVPVVVANPLGFPRTGLVSLPGGAAIGAQSVGSTGAVQANDDGSLVFMTTTPSLGYTTVYLDTENQGSASGTATLTQNGTQWTLANALLSATIDSSLSWDLSSLTDLTSNANILTAGNSLTFYTDAGNVYRYGNEMGDTMSVLTAAQTAGPIEVLENGPLRVSVRVSSTATLSNTTYTFLRTYTLVAGEPFLRMSITGSVPDETALMVSFAFQSGVTSLTRGTTYHWEDATTVLYWPLPVFYATHDWLLPIGSGGTPLAAIYHDAIPSWGYDSNGALLGNVLRNTYGEGNYGAQAYDWGTHTQHYALRVPSNLGTPETGQPLQEALQFTTPMLAATIAPPPLSPANGLPETLSLASVSSPSSAIVTAAKCADATPSDLILRIYQPTNSGQPVTVNTIYDATNAAVQTALEADYVNTTPGATVTQAANGSFTVQMNNALTTIRLPGVLG